MSPNQWADRQRVRVRNMTLDEYFAMDSKHDDVVDALPPHHFTFNTGPAPVGFYSLGRGPGTRFMLTQRPNWFHRLMVRLVLGWRWEDAA